MVVWQPSGSIATLKQRAEILAVIRAYFSEQNVIEVQTPVRSFATAGDPAIESLGVDDGSFLQTSAEYQMKRLLAAGSPSIYQLGPVFRAGESGRRHAVEFTMVEWYRLGFDDAALMQDVCRLVNRVLGEASFQSVTYRDLVDDADLIARAHTDDAVRDQLDVAFDDALRLLGPGRWFVTDFPARQAALARLRDDDPTVAARFELVIDGLELANGYFELSDADELTNRWLSDNAERKRRGMAVVPADDALLAAMRHGLPDCAGVALGVDRLVMIALGVDSIDEVLAFKHPPG